MKVFQNNIGFFLTSVITTLVNLSMYFYVIYRSNHAVVGEALAWLSFASLIAIVVRFGGSEEVFRASRDRASVNTAEYVEGICAVSTQLWVIAAGVLVIVSWLAGVSSYIFAGMAIYCLALPLGSILESGLLVDGRFAQVALSKIAGSLIIVGVGCFSPQSHVLTQLLFVFFPLAPSCFLVLTHLKKRRFSPFIQPVLSRTVLVRRMPLFTLSFLYMVPISLDKLAVSHFIGLNELVIYDWQFKLALVIEMCVYSPALGLLASRCHNELSLSTVGKIFGLSLVIFSLGGILDSFVPLVVYSIGIKNLIPQTGELYLSLLIGFVSLNFIASALKQRLLFLGCGSLVLTSNLVSLFFGIMFTLYQDVVKIKTIIYSLLIFVTVYVGLLICIVAFKQRR